ncbi:MAG: ATP-binding cassette domain-containing protein [Casimicrobium sp.]
MLTVSDLSHRYVANAPNAEIRFGSFSLDERHALLLRGGSGAGKSTLLHLLGGVLPIQPQSGTAVLAGQSLQSLTRPERDRLRPYTVGWMPQRQFLIASLTVLENVLLPASLAGRADAATRQRASELLQSFAIADFAHVRPHTLSVGQAARASLARALVTQPGLLLADEPTAALDAGSSRLVIEQMARYVERGGAAIIASHDPAIHALWDAVSGGKAALAELELPR